MAAKSIGLRVVVCGSLNEKLVSASELAEKYNISARTVNRRLAEINQGTDGKGLYDPELAHQLLTAGDNRVGRKRKN